MNNSKLLLVATAMITLVACNAAQKERIKEVGSVAVKVGSATLPLIGRIAAAYGSPYAELINAFTGTVSDEEDYEDDYEDEDEEDYEDEENEELVADETDDEETIDNAVIAQASNSENGLYLATAQDSNLDGLNSLSAQVDIVREVHSNLGVTATTVKDGELLTPADNYKLQLGCSIECYVYIAQLDSTGKMQPIAPNQTLGIVNPIVANQIYSLPNGNDWFYLDDQTGVETIYVIVSKTARPDIDLIFEKITAANKLLVQKEELKIEEPLLLTRGIGGVRAGSKATVEFQNGGQGDYISTVLQSIDADLVLTRWFQHGEV